MAQNEKMTAGYSGKPLPEKLGAKPGTNALFVQAPDELVEPWRTDLELNVDVEPIDFAMIFSADKGELNRHLQTVRPHLRPTGMIWAVWPKKASRVPTDITEDIIRDLAFPLGLVDVKVCAVSEIWSGLKLVIRRSER